MKRSFLILMVISIAVTVGFALALRGQTPPNTDTEKIVFTSNFPSDLAPTADKPQIFDPFSWQSFVALNWPADENGNPIEPENESTIGLYPNAPRIWQCYEHPEEVFQQDGKASAELNQKCQKTMILALSKEGEQADKNDRPKAVKVPLIDQQNNYVIYEIRVNPDETKQIRDNGWNEIKKLEKYDTLDECKEKKNKKENCNLFQFSTSDGARPLEIKAAWRVFDASTSSLEKARYYTTKQTLHIPVKYSTTGQDTEQEVELGLIGFHIAQKTANKNWIWSTFEQVDNLNVDVPPISPSLKPTLSNLHCTKENKCLPDNWRDKNETYFWREETPHAVTKKDGEIKELEPTQVKRLNKRGLSPSTKQLNERWRQKFQEIDSVWQYYQLIGTEWMFGLPCGLFSNNTNNCSGISVSQFFNDPTNFIFSPVANVTMETYTEPQNSSCVKCHAGASLTQAPERRTDFSFLLDEYAK